ncbi:hypothetical protein PSYRMG_11620 [Pseudomonas syringae UMAF0158]|nr:hypothetical protein PSYRMG_11620 [Pseudomonas syringae UMAF0158]
MLDQQKLVGLKRTTNPQTQATLVSSEDNSFKADPMIAVHFINDIHY